MPNDYSLPTAPEFWRGWLRNLKDAMASEGHRAADLAKLLCLSRAAAYSRLRGEVPFNLYEALAVQEAYGIPLAPGSTNQEPIRFSVATRLPGGFDAAGYLGGLTRAGAVLRDKPGRLARTKMLISSTEVPVFRLFAEPALVAVKLFLFATAHATALREPFDLTRAYRKDADHIREATQLYDLYTRVATTEAWGPVRSSTSLRSCGTSP